MTVYSHCTENHIFFFRASWKDSLSKKNLAGIWSFLYYWKIWYFFFPKIWSYLQTENERWTLSKKKKKKIQGNMKFWSNVMKIWSFQKGTCPDLIFLVLSGKVVFFPQNMVFFPWTENEGGMTFLKRYTETWYFPLDIFHVVLQK